MVSNNALVYSGLLAAYLPTHVRHDVFMVAYYCYCQKHITDYCCVCVYNTHTHPVTVLYKQIAKNSEGSYTTY